MKIFIDSADIEEIEEAMKSGVVDGVTTNPSLIKKAQKKHKVEDMEEYIKKILKLLGDKPVSLEVTETSFEGMQREARRLGRIFKRYNNVVIKVPVNPSTKYNDSESFDGLKLIKELADDGVDVNTTVVMSAEQAYLAAKAGARYVSPFAGRIDDFIRQQKMGMTKGTDFDKHDYFPAEGQVDKDGNIIDDEGIVSGVDLVWAICDIFRNMREKDENFNCEVLAASCRNPRQVRELAQVGADVATMPLDVLKKMTSHHKTVEGVNNFAADTVDEYRELLEEKKGFINFVKD